MSPSTMRSSRLAGACAALTVLIAGCSLFTSGPTPVTSPGGGQPTPGTTISTETATPSPTPQLVKSITLVAAIGEPKDWTPAGLTWNGIQKAGAQIGAATALIEPVSNAELQSDVEKAAGTAAAVVVTVGPDADPGVQAAAAAHPTTQFLEMNVVVSDTSPPNVHGLVFDEAEAGYLGGYVAASFAGSGKVGFVGNETTEVSSVNYVTGVRAGAAELGPGVGVVPAYAGTPDAPDRGRTAAATVVKAGSTVILAPLSLSGIGALREACEREAGVVGLGMDAWQIVPDIQSCVIVSVLERGDAAVTAAILSIADGRRLPALTVYDVASGGIALSDFHATLPAGFRAELDSLMASLRAGPPRPTPGPSITAGPAAASSSPKPSGT